MKAFLKNYRQSPRKVALVAAFVRGKSVPVAQAALRFLPQKSAPDILKLLNSAVANATQQGFSSEDLKIKTISVNKGMSMRRYMPRSRGRATRIEKTSSHVTIELASISGAVPTPKAKAETVTPARKVAAKSVAKKAASVKKTTKPAAKKVAKK